MSSSCSEEVDLLQDSKYRSYIQSVEKALKSFENTSEWADLISALGKLNKVLQSHKKYDVIPKKVTIGKRLAQCLHPALPAGVHLKAMETYDIIFNTIGTTRLAKDMFIYSAGLFPLLSFAAMNVRPTLLAIYENHFLPLGQSLRPGLTGLLMGVLPGLEEGSDHFDRTNSLLEEFCKVTDSTFFYGCLWECVLSAPTIRLPAVNYVLAHYNRKLSMEDQLYIMGTNIDIMVQALSSAVEDKSALVQRSALELLLSGFPMHNSQLTRPDMIKLLTSGIYVVLRRDMSLNRRLYAWLLGTDVNGTPLLSVPEQHNKQLKRCDSSESGETELHYFNTYSKTLLVLALKSVLSEERGSEEEKENRGKQTLSAGLKPFRILISLLDKPEIGSSVVEDVLVEVFRCLYRECAVELQSKLSKKSRGDIYREGSISSMDMGAFHSTENNVRKHDRLSNELIKTANLFFGTFEPYFLWDFLTKTFENVCKAKEPTAEKGKPKFGAALNSNLGVSEFCSLASFLLDTVTLETYTETQTEYLPELLGHITTSITDHCKVLTDSEVTDALKLCSKILAHVLPSMTPLSDNDSDSSCDDEDIFDGNCSSVTLTSATPEKRGNDSEMASREGSLDPTRKTDDECYESAVSDLESDKTHPSDPSDKGKLTVPGKGESNAKNKDKTPPRSPLKLYTSKHSADQIPKKPLTTMQACVQSFQTFFTTFSYHRITPDTGVLDDCLQRLMKGYEDKVYSEDNDTSNSESDDSHKPTGDDFKIQPPSTAGKQCSEAFMAACQLLIDFSSFPLYCTDHSLILDKTFGVDGDMFPPWLKILLSCACYMDNFDIQAGAVSAMLDLLTLTGSILDQCEDLARKRHCSASDGTVSVVIVPPLAPKVFRHINGTPKFYKIVAERLWCYLGQDSPNCHQKGVELFFQLHQLAPTEWVCEDVIGNALVSENERERVEAHQKFAVLWHLTREVRHKPGMPQVKRTFERSLFVLLDSLILDSSPTKMLATEWLQHAIQRGDINRVLEPVLLLLLHPDTARISIQHVDIHQPRKVRLSESNDESDHEAKIYAISSEGGNVIYHVSSDVKQVGKKNAEDLRTMAALTTIGEKETTKIAPEKVHQDLFFEKVNPDAMNMFVNPFGSNTSLDKAMREGYEPPPSEFPDVGKVKRLDKDICQKEGITFDDDVDEEAKEVEEDSDETKAEDFAQEIVEELLDQVLHNVDKDANSQGSQESLCQDRDQRSSSIVSKASSNEDLLNKIQSRISEVDSSSECDPLSERREEMEEIPGIHPLHTHILLYAQKYDCQRTLYALTILKSMIASNPKLFMCTIASTSISSRRTAHLVKLQNLLARHRKSVFGKNFFGDLTGEAATYRNSMYLEILISVCLYFVRSYYPNLMTSELSEQELIGNKEVQILATEVLSSLLLEMISVVKESGKSFAFYATELLNKCKVQKAALHCALSSVYNTRKLDTSAKNISFTDAIVGFNDNYINPSTIDAFQSKLLNVLLKIVILEDCINKTKTDQDQTVTTSTDWERSQVTFVPQLLSSATFKARQPVAYQGMFLSAILSGLKQQHMAHMHQQWMRLVISCLPHVGKALPDLVNNVVCQLCKNLEFLASEYAVGGGNYRRTPRHPDKIPPDHVISVLEGLTGICHFCLLDNTNQVSVGGTSAATSAQSLESKSSGQIFNNLIHVFNPAHSREPSPLKEVGPLPPVVEARRLLLSILPRVIAALTVLWKAIDISEAREDEEQPCWTMGSPKAVRQCILEFLSPISLYHGVNLLGSVAVVWNDRRKREAGSHRKKKAKWKKVEVIPNWCEDQLLLVELVSSVRVLPTDTLIQTLRQVIKSPPPTNQDRNKKRVPLEVSMLQFFYAYVERTPAPQLLDSWSSLLALFKEGLQLALVPPGQFLLLGILHVFVHKIPPMESRKDHKDLQDIAQKLLEACSLIAGSSLEQTTWLRRNLAVKPGPQNDVVAAEDHEHDAEGPSSVPLTLAQSKAVLSSSHAQYSVQALVMLAETIASVLDIVYGSDEKDKVVPFLNANIMYHVFPYLKHHSTHNLPSLRACSQILCSLSGYQYTRKAWKKEAFEMLLDPTFFQMDVIALQNWRIVIDNLMTHDKTSFRDLITRVSVNPSTAINIFSSKEQEFEQRAQLLKRLSFTIFCSELDQYARYMPEIQERLAENLRNSLVPAVQQQVFLCFRVLMLRMSPHHLTSLWPTMITELVHVFLQMEQELASDFEDRGHSQSMANLDSTWANGYLGHSSPDWLQLYLGACKLLDLALALPAEMLPQFQLYRWAFVGDPGLEEEQRKPGTSCFSPHIVRLAKIMKKKSKEQVRLIMREPGKPLLTTSYIKTLYDLHGFFSTLSQSSQSGYSLQSVSTADGQSKSAIHKSKSAPDMRRVNSITSLPSLRLESMSNKRLIEFIIEKDFVEPM
ncbi:LOW QUALITY PROTEIN: protein dopey-1-like [Lingula anatina]|uniref:LOW QUALITY PROTEIN: protein dopey-1-like n=1 Tax=Lingula anatina TaxID=7574 RepID=A0A1S3HV30_LINAN|nr:LOW QUALITY PROTEIN: protein dopey-1-like [Lingula anatina]|eukprot:XP_013389897.1 LOW QUALITY PROTEIN: protein dopey-1-like [Lingula anatina]